ncbi:MAG: ABC transporter ATP-binding protein [Phycisphaerales bacterium JB047]
MPLTADSIAFSYPKSPPVLESVSCAITPGSVTAIVGPNGAGKSTLIRLLAGLRIPDSGAVRLDDQALSSFTPRDRAQRIAFLEQRPTLAFDFSVLRVVSFGAFTGERDCAHIADALRLFELQPIEHKPFASLSVGQQQRVAFARAWVQIAGRSQAYLLADEPCSAMDPRHTLQTMHTMRSLADNGIGVGVVLHDLNIAAQYTDRAIVLDSNGRVVASGQSDQALSPETLSSVFEVPITRHTLEPGRSVLTIGDPA